MTKVFYNYQMPFFWNHVSYKLGDGYNIRFWEGKWIKNQPLKELFPNIYRISNAKGSPVKDLRLDNGNLFFQRFSAFSLFCFGWK